MDKKLGREFPYGGGDLLYVDNRTPYLRKGEACIQKSLGSSQSDKILGGIVFPPADFDAWSQKSNLIPVSDSSSERNKAFPLPYSTFEANP
jgi:hypothetical protein